MLEWIVSASLLIILVILLRKLPIAPWQRYALWLVVLVRLLIPVCTVLRREREQQIHDLALHDIQLHNELTAYQRSQVDIEVVIRKNPHYQSSPLYQMIRRDIEAFLKIAK